MKTIAELMNMKGRRELITGATGGIGRVIPELYVARPQFRPGAWALRMVSKALPRIAPAACLYTVPAKTCSWLVDETHGY